MAKALCTRCKGTAEGSTFAEASSKLNHAVGLGRGLPCGANYGKTIDVSPKTVTPSEPKRESKQRPTRERPAKVTEEKITEVKEETIVKKE